MKELEEENKRSDAIIIALLKERFENKEFNINQKAKYIEFPIRTSMGLLHFKTEAKNFIS